MYEGFWVCRDCLIGDVETLTVGALFPKRCCICGHVVMPKDIVAVSVQVFQTAVMRVNDAGGRT